MTEEKRKVTMVNEFVMPDGSTGKQEAVDHVPVDQLEAYVADAKTRWRSVTVEEVDTN